MLGLGFAFIIFAVCCLFYSEKAEEDNYMLASTIAKVAGFCLFIIGVGIIGFSL